MKRLLLLAVVILTAGLTFAVVGASTSAAGGHVKNYKHIFIIMMENTGIEALQGNPNAPWINQAPVSQTVPCQWPASEAALRMDAAGASSAPRTDVQPPTARASAAAPSTIVFLVMAPSACPALSGSTHLSDAMSAILVALTPPRSFLAPCEWQV